MSTCVICASDRPRSFSALQRAENSSIRAGLNRPAEIDRFQCSSASRKFLNRMSCTRCNRCRHVSVLFSEPKIPQSHSTHSARKYAERFQCSSASRKFLNFPDRRAADSGSECFSALQRAENSSIQFQV